MGNCIIEESEVAEYIKRWYMDLYTMGLEDSQRRTWDIPNWPICLFEKEAQALSILVEEKEIKDGLWALKAFKAPGLDRLHAGFYQRFWMIMRKSVMDLVKKVFETGCISSYVNKTLITLIPKHLGADSLGNYRLISLCNTVYKVISKVIVFRLRPYLDRLISLMQEAFVPSRKCADNAIIVQELLHTMSLKKGKVGYMAMKINLEKAYDRLEWSFIRDTLTLSIFLS